MPEDEIDWGAWRRERKKQVPIERVSREEESILEYAPLLEKENVYNRILIFEGLVGLEEIIGTRIPERILLNLIYKIKQDVAYSSNYEKFEKNAGGERELNRILLTKEDSFSRFENRKEFEMRKNFSEMENEIKGPEFAKRILGEYVKEKLLEGMLTTPKRTASVEQIARQMVEDKETLRKFLWMKDKTEPRQKAIEKTQNAIAGAEYMLEEKTIKQEALQIGTFLGLKANEIEKIYEEKVAGGKTAILNEIKKQGIEKFKKHEQIVNEIKKREQEKAAKRRAETAKKGSVV